MFVEEKNLATWSWAAPLCLVLIVEAEQSPQVTDHSASKAPRHDTDISTSELPLQRSSLLFFGCFLPLHLLRPASVMAAPDAYAVYSLGLLHALPQHRLQPDSKLWVLPQQCLELGWVTSQGLMAGA